MKRHITFQNERGRSIRLEVRKHLLEDDATKGFTYIMTGPTSMTEQTMTRLEAHLLATLIAEQMGYQLVERVHTAKSPRMNRRTFGMTRRPI